MKSYIQRYFLRVALGAALAVLFVYALSLFAQPVLAAMNVWPQPEGFTELYFDLPLPIQATSGSVAFSFTMGNHEGATRDYDYIVYAQSAAGAQILNTGSLELQDGQSQSVDQTYPATNPNEEFFVQLPTLGEEIHFSISARNQ